MKALRRVSVPMLIVALLLAALGTALLFLDTTVTTETRALIGKHSESLGQLTPDSPAAQTFTVTEDGLSAVEVMVTTYAKKVAEGTLTLTLKDDTGATVGRAEIPAAELKNNSFVTLALDRPLSSAGKTYTLCAASDITDQKGVSLRIGEAENIGTLTLADGTRSTESAANIRLTCSHTQLGTMPMMTCVLIALCFLAAALLPGKRD